MTNRIWRCIDMIQWELVFRTISVLISFTEFGNLLAYVKRILLDHGFRGLKVLWEGSYVDIP